MLTVSRNGDKLKRFAIGAAQDTVAVDATGEHALEECGKYLLKRLITL